ncbi:MAG: hypothetical protein ERJ69_10055, partial [Aphanocapsa feldmannii 288cV]
MALPWRHCASWCRRRHPVPHARPTRTSPPITMREPADQLLTELGALPFADFLALQNGAWRSERTYFHLSPDDPTRQERERSTTTFQVRPLQPEGLARVMADNSYRLDPQLPSPCGFHLGFDTLNEFGETRSMQLNLLFVTTSDQGQL